MSETPGADWASEQDVPAILEPVTTDVGTDRIVLDPEQIPELAQVVQMAQMFMPTATFPRFEIQGLEDKVCVTCLVCDDAPDVEVINGWFTECTQQDQVLQALISHVAAHFGFQL